MDRETNIMNNKNIKCIQIVYRPHIYTGLWIHPYRYVGDFSYSNIYIVRVFAMKKKLIPEFCL